MDDFIYAPPPPAPSAGAPVPAKPETVAKSQAENKNKQPQNNKKRPAEKNTNNGNSTNKKQKTGNGNGNALRKKKQPELSGDEDDNDDDFSDEESKHAAAIQGTNIVLETDEDIAKWIEERKKNWPSELRVKQKEEEKAERQRIIGAQTNSSHQNKAPGSNGNNTNGNKRVCKFYARTKKCKNGNNCKFLHEAGSNTTSALISGDQERARKENGLLKKLPNHKTAIIHGIPVQVPLRFKPSINGGKSLHNLVMESEQISKENHILLDLFDDIVHSGLIDSDWDKLKKELRLD